MTARFQAVDHHTLLRAFARVTAESPRSLLLLAGSPLKNEIEDLARGMGIGSRVQLRGFRPDIPDLLTAADAGVLSSISEAMPMALLEAAAAGLPCVATDVGRNSEVIVHGVTGFLVPPSNPEALANAMLRLSILPWEARMRMGERARNHFTLHFRINPVAV